MKRKRAQGTTVPASTKKRKMSDSFTIPVTAPEPPNWNHYFSKTCNSSSIIGTFEIGNGTKECRALNKFISPFRLISAKKIVNPELWNRFTDQRISMIKSKTEDVALLSELGVSKYQLDRARNLSNGFAKHDLFQQKSSEYFPNEVLLFHCTSSMKNLDKILIEGLDERLGSKGRLGKGIYFADDLEKSSEYDGTGGNVIIFGVLLGDCLSVDGMSNMDSFVREPEKDPTQKRNLNDLFFDSITGKPPQGDGHNEYVIFNKAQCCPLYLVKYQRGYKEYPETECDYGSARKEDPEVAWRKIPNEEAPMPNPERKATWPFFAVNLFKKMGKSRPPNKKSTANIDSLADSNKENVVPSKVKETKNQLLRDCSVCRKTRCVTVPWNELKCNHIVCPNCCKDVEITRTTMSGAEHTFMKCPVCQETTGTEVGDCPDGMMIVKYIPDRCDGFNIYNTIQINYKVKSEEHKHKDGRPAYLPNSKEGKAVLQLLRMAWDRRLCFKIGTSETTGEINVPVWNIQHKSELTGGPTNHGYPDADYFNSVKEQLRAYGIG